MGSILGESEIKQLVEQHLDKAVDAAFIGEMVAGGRAPTICGGVVSV